MIKFILTGLLVQLWSVGFTQIQLKEFVGGQQVGNDISGTVVSIVSNSDTSFVKSFYVENTSGTPMNMAIQRLRISGVDCWQDGITWAPVPDLNFEGMCFAYNQMPTNPWTTINAPVIPAASGAVFEVNIQTYDQGCSDYRYRVMNGNVALDSIDLQICSTVLTSCLPSELDEMYLQSVVEIYPNPSVNELYFYTLEPCEILIHDLSGKEISFFNLIDSCLLNLTLFESGTYIVTIRKKGIVTEYRKIMKQ
jgi:hypothetical protein